MRAMFENHDVREIARILKIPQEEVEDIWDRLHGGRCDVVLRCNRTGRIWWPRSWRRAYYIVCLLGLTDWGWWRAEVWNAWGAAR